MLYFCFSLHKIIHLCAIFTTTFIQFYMKFSDVILNIKNYKVNIKTFRIHKIEKKYNNLRVQYVTFF